MDSNLEGKQEDSTPRENPEFNPPPAPEVQVVGPSQYRLAGLVQADHVEISTGAAVGIVAREVSVDRGGSLINIGRNLEVRQGGSQWLVAGEAHLEQSGSGIMIANRVNAASSWVGVMVAGSVEGDVRPVLDTQGAIRFGAAFGTVVGVFLLIRRILGGR